MRSGKTITRPPSRGRMAPRLYEGSGIVWRFGRLSIKTHVGWSGMPAGLAGRSSLQPVEALVGEGGGLWGRCY